MGYEYSIVLSSGEYKTAIDELAKAFQSFSTQYVVETNGRGFSLTCPEYANWAHGMQISVETADEYTCNVPKGTEYIYYLSYLFGDEAHKAMELMKSTLCSLGYEFKLDDL